MTARRHGFSLVELSFVLIIMMILAGLTSAGGSYLSNQAKSQKMVEVAKEMFAAVKSYHAKRRMWPEPADSDTASLQAALSPYLDRGITTFTNPWTGATDQLTTKQPPFVQADYGAVPGPSNWGLGSPTGKRLFYFRCQLCTPATGITVWDQDRSYNFRFYAVQALDHQGKALVTYGE